MNDAQSMFIHLSQSYPGIEHLITGACYLLGVVFTLKAIWALKVYGEMRTMMSGQHSLKMPVMYFVVGTVMLFIPTAVPVFMQTTFGYDKAMPLAYANTYQGISSQAMNAVLGFVQIIGFIAFMRGWIQLVHVTQQSGSHGPGGAKAWTHIIGGLLAINIVGTKEIIWATLGF